MRKQPGEFKRKHPPDRQVSPGIAAAVSKRKRNDELSCAQAERIAREQQAPLGEIGVALDMMEIRIGKCQLGLFGYQPAGKSVTPAPTVPAELESAIRSALVDGRLPCAAAWNIAAKGKLPRKKIAAACEALRIKIKPCQLGAF